MKKVVKFVKYGLFLVVFSLAGMVGMVLFNHYFKEKEKIEPTILTKSEKKILTEKEKATLRRAKSREKVVLKDYALKKDRFGIVQGSFTMENGSDGTISDIEIHCEYYAESNALLETSKRVVHQIVLEKEVKKLNSLSFGVAPAQTVKNVCRVTSYMFEGVRVWY